MRPRWGILLHTMKTYCTYTCIVYTFRIRMCTPVITKSILKFTFQKNFNLNSFQIHEKLMFIVIIILSTFLIIIIGTLHGTVKLTRIYNTHILFCKIVNLYFLSIHLLYNIICILHITYIFYTHNINGVYYLS